MSANRNAQLRYRIIDRCLKDFSRYYTIYDIADAVNEVFYDLYNDEISVRTIRKDLYDMEERTTFNAPIKKIRHTDKRCFIDIPTRGLNSIPTRWTRLTWNAWWNCSRSFEDCLLWDGLKRPFRA